MTINTITEIALGVIAAAGTIGAAAIAVYHKLKDKWQAKDDAKLLNAMEEVEALSNGMQMTSEDKEHKARELYNKSRNLSTKRVKATRDATIERIQLICKGTKCEINRPKPIVNEVKTEVIVPVQVKEEGEPNEYM